jgi:hypothetical protein
VSRVAQILDRRNLLQSHSELGRSRRTLIGRQDYILEANGRWRGEVSLAESSGPAGLTSTDATTDPRSYSSRISERLEKKADEYYRLGIEYFRESQYPKSRDYFQLVRQLEDDHPRAFVADVLVSLQGGDVHTAITSLIHAIKRAESLADLSIEWKEFYAKEQDFLRVINSVNVAAKSGAGLSKSMSLMLAYYSFLKGDVNTAISEAKVASEESTRGAPANVAFELDSDRRRENPLVDAAKRFGELLVETRDQGGAPESNK